MIFSEIFKYVESHLFTEGENMSNITLAIPDDLHTKMKAHSEIRWSEVVRKSILEKIELLEAMDKIAKKSKLSKNVVEKIVHKINKEVFASMNKS